VLEAEIVRGAEIVVVAAGVLVAADVVAVAVDVLVAAAVDATAVTGAVVAEDGTNFGHGSSLIPRINQEGSNEKDRRKCGPFSLCRAK
jgi:hypothetical protein